MDRLRRYGLLAGLVVLAITGPAGAATAKTTKLTKAEKAKIKPCAKNGWKSLLRGESDLTFKSQKACESYALQKRKTLTLNDLRATPNPMSFTAVNVVQPITFTNAGSRSIEINSILVGSPGDITNFTCGALLGPKATCVVNVQVTSIKGNSAFFGKPLVSILYSRDGLERNTTVPIDVPAA